MDYHCDRCGKDGPLGGYSVNMHLTFCPDCWRLLIEMRTRHVAEEGNFLEKVATESKNDDEIDPKEGILAPGP